MKQSPSQQCKLHTFLSDVEQFLIATSDGSMSKNNSENIAMELLEQLRELRNENIAK